MARALLAVMWLVSTCGFAQMQSGKDDAKPPVAQTTNNVELDKIYSDDQGEREGKLKLGPGVMERDRERRKQVAALIDAGKLQTGDDFFHAAMVYQHGETADDILKAHELAILGAVKGNTEAIWLTAASLDRYLQRIGKPQVFGTQFNWKEGQPWTMEPFDRSFISDAFRAQFHVPPIAKQQEKLKNIQQQSDKKQ